MRERNCPKSCGTCCEVVLLSFPKKDFKKHEDYKLLLRIWHRISKKKAIELRPQLKNISKGHYFYTCNQYNKLTRSCMIYSKRPRACKGFPFYEKSVVNAQALPQGCYWANQVMRYL